MDFAKKVIEFRDVAKEITTEEQKKRSLVNSIQEDFKFVEKSVEVVESVVTQEPTAMMKLFGSAFPADDELEKLAGQALEAVSTVAKASNPLAPVLLMQKIEELERKEQKKDDDSPSILKDSALLMNIHYKAHAGSLQQKRQVVENHEEMSEHEDEPPCKMTIAAKKIEAQYNAEKEQKEKQDSKRREFDKASPEKKEKLLEKDKQEAEDQNSTTMIMNFLESFLSGKLELTETIQNMKSLKEIEQTKRERVNELDKQLMNIKERKKQENAAKQMKKMMKQLSDFPNKLRLSKKYLLSASEEHSMEKEPFKSCLPNLAKENHPIVSEMETESTLVPNPQPKDTMDQDHQNAQTLVSLASMLDTNERIYLSSRSLLEQMDQCQFEDILDATPQVKEEWEDIKRKLPLRDHLRAAKAFKEKICSCFRQNLGKTAIMESLNLSPKDIPAHVMNQLSCSVKYFEKEAYSQNKKNDAAFLKEDYQVPYDLVNLAANKLKVSIAETSQDDESILRDGEMETDDGDALDESNVLVGFILTLLISFY